MTFLSVAAWLEPTTLVMFIINIWFPMISNFDHTGRSEQSLIFRVSNLETCFYEVSVYSQINQHAELRWKVPGSRYSESHWDGITSGSQSPKSTPCFQGGCRMMLLTCLSWLLIYVYIYIYTYDYNCLLWYLIGEWYDHMIWLYTLLLAFPPE